MKTDRWEVTVVMDWIRRVIEFAAIFKLSWGSKVVILVPVVVLFLTVLLPANVNAYDARLKDTSVDGTFTSGHGGITLRQQSFRAARAADLPARSAAKCRRCGMNAVTMTRWRIEYYTEGGPSVKIVAARSEIEALYLLSLWLQGAGHDVTHIAVDNSSDAELIVATEYGGKW